MIASDRLREVGEWIIWTSVALTALGVLLAKSGLRRLVLWVWRKSVAEPIGKWLESLMERVFNRLIEPFKATNESQHLDVQKRLSAVETAMTDVQVNTRYLAVRSEAHDQTLEAQATTMHEQGEAMSRVAGALDALEKMIAASTAKTKEHTP